MNVLHVAYGSPRCPVSDQGTGRCGSPAVVPVKIGCQLGVGAYLTVCHYHADVIEETE